MNKRVIVGVTVVTLAILTMAMGAIARVQPIASPKPGGINDQELEDLFNRTLANEMKIQFQPAEPGQSTAISAEEAKTIAAKDLPPEQVANARQITAELVRYDNGFNNPDGSSRAANQLVWKVMFFGAHHRPHGNIPWDEENSGASNFVSPNSIAVVLVDPNTGQILEGGSWAPPLK